MPSFLPRHLTLRDGQKMVVREATGADAAPLLAYVETISGESPFLTIGPGDFKMTVDQEADYLTRCQETPNMLYLIGVIGDEIVGSASVAGAPRPRLKHRVDLGMSVRQSHWRQGIGALLLDAVVDWTRINPMVTKLDLQVSTTNTGAVALYTKVGFVKEGTLRCQMMVDGVSQDLFAMGLFVD